ncbi:MAG: MFS transporter [Chloroflexota bacterium]
MIIAVLGWRSVFFINLPFGLAAMAFTSYGVACSMVQLERSFDLPGQLAGVAALGFLAATLIEGGELGWKAPPILAGFALFSLALVVFIAIERRSAAPMLPVDFFKIPAVSAIQSVAAIINFAFYGQFFILALFFQKAWGATPLATGFAFLPMTVSVTTANLTVGPKVGRIGGRVPMAVGQLLCAAGYIGLLRVDQSSAYLAIFILLAIIGAGGGLVVPAMTSAFLETVGSERAGIASGVLQASRQIGGVVGVALFGSLVAQAGLVRGMHQGQAVAAAAMLIGCALTLSYVSRGQAARSAAELSQKTSVR